MKKIMNIGIMLLVVIAMVSLSDAQDLRQKVGWNEVTHLSDREPIPADETVSYIVYAGESQETLTERMRTNETVVDISDLNLGSEETWIGVAAYTDKRFRSDITSKNMITINMDVEFRIIYRSQD